MRGDMIYHRYLVFMYLNVESFQHYERTVGTGGIQNLIMLLKYR